MNLVNKKKFIILIASVVIVILVALGFILFLVLKEEVLPPIEDDSLFGDGDANLTVKHQMTVKEAKFVSGVLPITLLLPEDIDDDITFNYGSLGYYEGINKDNLAKIREYAKINDASKLDSEDFKYLKFCGMTIKKDNYYFEYIIYDEHSATVSVPDIQDVVNQKDEDKFKINRTYYYDKNTTIIINVYPSEYKSNIGYNDWLIISNDEKIELYGREWFDSVELNDIDEFMKEVCAYNGINSDWLDNKPIYNIK